jgi:hypothetical protein
MDVLLSRARVLRECVYQAVEPNNGYTHHNIRKVLDLNQNNKVIPNDPEPLTFHHFCLNNSFIVSHLKIRVGKFYLDLLKGAT